MKNPESLKEKMELAIDLFKVLNLKDDATLLQFILNKGITLYGDHLYDMQLSNIVLDHINENQEIIRKSNLMSNTSEIKLLMKQNLLLLDYLTLIDVPVDRAVARYANRVP